MFLFSCTRVRTSLFVCSPLLDLPCGDDGGQLHAQGQADRLTIYSDPSRIETLGIETHGLTGMSSSNGRSFSRDEAAAAQAPSSSNGSSSARLIGKDKRVLDRITFYLTVFDIRIMIFEK
jgi:hypothetical protein